MENGKLENSVSLFTNLMQSVSKPMQYILQFGKREEKKPWFDKDCIRKKKEIIKHLNKLTRLNTKKQPKRYQKQKCVYINQRWEYQN